MSEPELIFHDTVPLPEEHLEKHRRNACIQRDEILGFFASHPNESFTPAEVWERHFLPLLLTSVRRSITDLTKEGRLIKCDYSESRKGQYGTLNRVWKYNTKYVPPITPQTKDKSWALFWARKLFRMGQK
jgi:hypothetical protein